VVCCSPSLYKPTLADVECGKKEYPDLTIGQMNQGMELYSNKCGSCHTLYKPKEVSRAKWDKILPEMKLEAKLSDKEYELISRYVKAKNASLSN
jgi:hypothetical protein